MADNDSGLRVVRQSSDGRRRYDEAGKRVLIEAALRPGVSVARMVTDDLATTPLTDSARRDLLEILDDRHGKRSTIVTSQIPVNDWHAALADPTLADAILDRLVHNAHRITMDGESMRKPQNGLTSLHDSK